jgi:hypothetical protein
LVTHTTINNATALDAAGNVNFAAALPVMPYEHHESLHSVCVRIHLPQRFLHGIVFDDWDLRSAMRIAKRMPGVKREVNDLEIKLGGE